MHDDKTRPPPWLQQLTSYAEEFAKLFDGDDDVTTESKCFRTVDGVVPSHKAGAVGGGTKVQSSMSPRLEEIRPIGFLLLNPKLR